MSDKKVIVITGATGVVGLQLIKSFQQRGGVELRVLSRSSDKVRERLGGDVTVVGSYEDKEQIISGSDVLIHLATRNTDRPGTLEDFERDNCELTISLAKTAKEMGVKHFVFATSTKALNPKPDQLYGQSKAKAELELAAVADENFSVSLLRLCPVYGKGSRGKIRHLQNLPLGLGKLSLSIIRSFLPIVSASCLLYTSPSPRDRG